MSINDSYSKKKIYWLVAVVVLIIGIGYLYYQSNIDNHIISRPVGEHEWAQIDRASMALTYHMDHPSFWLPRCHRTHRNPEGITAGEFPLIPYSVSKLYDAFGFKEWLHRGFVLLITVIGFIYSFLLANRYIKDPLLSAGVIVCWLLSPNILYYSISFLPDTPSLAFIIIAFYYLTMPKEKIKTRHYILCSFFATLAILIKLSTFFPFLAVALIYFYFNRKSIFVNRINKALLVILMIVPILCGFLWTLYAHHIIHTYHIFTFLLEFLPPESFTDLKKGLLLSWELKEHYYSNSYYFILLILFIVGLIFYRKGISWLLIVSIGVIISGIPLYLVVFQKSPVHFYYWIPFQVSLLFFLIWVINLLVELNQKIPIRWALVLSFGILVFHQSSFIKRSVYARFDEGNPIYKSYYNLESYLSKIGIPYGSQIATYSDPSYNNSLYLMNRKGWTLDTGTNSKKLHDAFNACDYAVINDTSIAQNPEFYKYFSLKVGEYNDISIYKLH